MFAKAVAYEHLFGLAAEFDSAEALQAAARHISGVGYTRAEAYTPFPIEGLAESLGMKRTYMAPVVLGGAIVGGAAAYFMMWFANVIHYPWNIGGRPPNSWPMFMPITFELAVLFAATSGVIALFLFNRLPQLYHPMFNIESFTRASRDGFFICIEATDPRFDLHRTRTMLESLGPLAVMEVPK